VIFIYNDYPSSCLKLGLIIVVEDAYLALTN